jgi:hypothetical protein
MSKETYKVPVFKSHGDGSFSVTTKEVATKEEFDAEMDRSYVEAEPKEPEAKEDK